MPNNEEEGDGPKGAIDEKRLAEMVNTFIERWGDTSRRLQEASEDRLERVNGMAAALCRLSIEAMAERVISVKADRDRIREQLSACQRSLAESQMEVRRLTDINESQQRTIDSAMRELAHGRGGGNTTNIGDVSGHRS